MSGAIEEFVWLQASPTITQRSLAVTCDMPHPGSVVLRVYNTAGQAVMHERIEAVREGALTHLLDVSRLPAGSYFLHVARSFGGRSFDARTMLFIRIR